MPESIDEGEPSLFADDTSKLSVSEKNPEE